MTNSVCMHHMDEAEIYRTVEARRHKLGLTQAEVSRRAFGRSDTGPIQHLRRGKSPTARTLRSLCRALNLEFYVGPPRSVFDDHALADVEEAMRKGAWSDRTAAPIVKAVDVADVAEESKGYLVDTLKSALLAGHSPETLPQGIPGDSALADIVKALQKVGWSDGRIAAWARAMESSDPAFGSGAFLMSAWKAALLAAVASRPPPDAVEGGRQVHNREIVDADGNLIPRSLLLQLDSWWRSGFAMLSRANLPPSAWPVEIAELAATARSDADIASEKGAGSMWFRQDWLAGRGLDPAQCAVVRASGKSMEPLLSEGAPILVDRKRRRRIENRIFVVRTDDGLIVKRAGRDDGGKWQLLSEHPSWEPVPWPREAEMIGQAVWTARSLV